MRIQKKYSVCARTVTTVIPIDGILWSQWLCFQAAVLLRRGYRRDAYGLVQTGARSFSMYGKEVCALCTDATMPKRL